MEERKRRIERRYRRERADLQQGDLVVPDFSEAALELESERFRDPSTLLQKDTPVAPPPPPPRLVPRPESRNWLLLEEADTESGQRANERGSRGGVGRSGAYDPGSAGGLSGWRQEGGSLLGDRGAESRPSVGPGSLRDTAPGGGTGVSGFGQGRSLADGLFTSPFGRPGVADPLPRPFSQQAPASRPAPDPRSPNAGFIPFQGRNEPRREAATTAPRVGEPSIQQDFQRADPYQQWRKRNREIDPAKESTYLDELLRRNRR